MNLRLDALNIGKSYNGNEVLRDCTFSFDGRGIYVLTGPNGCGKSTFLRICALLEAGRHSPAQGVKLCVGDAPIAHDDRFLVGTVPSVVGEKAGQVQRGRGCEHCTTPAAVAAPRRDISNILEGPLHVGPALF